MDSSCAGGRDAVVVDSNTLNSAARGPASAMTPRPCPSSPLARITKAYGLRPLFEKATFTIRRGEKVALLGPNGTGKSTLLARPRRPRAARHRQHRSPPRRLHPLPPAGARARPDADAREIAARVSRSGTPPSRATTRFRGASAKARASDELMTEQASLAEDVERLGGWSRDHEVDEILASSRRARRRAPGRNDERRREASRRARAHPRRQARSRDLRRADQPSRRRHHHAGSRSTWSHEFPGAVLLGHARSLPARQGRVARLRSRGRPHRRVHEAQRSPSAPSRTSSSKRPSVSRTPSASSRTGRTSSAKRSNGFGAARRRARRSRRRASSARRRRSTPRACACAARSILVGLESGSSRLGGTILELST